MWQSPKFGNSARRSESPGSATMPEGGAVSLHNPVSILISPRRHFLCLS